MSGFAGVIRFDDRRVEQDTLARLRDAVAHRGPDAQGQWCDERVAFVHAMLRTTPESVRESQPYVDGDLVIVADTRLDLDDSRDDALTDVELIAAAYRKWGNDCLRHLEGDFAFAIWNRRDRTLFCARDAFGVKPFVYAHVPGKLFAFGSEVRAVLAHDEVSRELDESRIADYLVFYFHDTEQTFYQSVKRMPGGSSLTLRDGAITKQTWWSPRDVKPLTLKGGDAAYAEGYLEHFKRAVRTRMRVTDPSHLGALLSGGLDSTSIACFARNEIRATGGPPLPTFSWIFSDALSADEREYQQAVIAEGGFRPFTLDSAVVDSSPWTDLPRLISDGPVYAVNYYLNTRIAEVAAQNGVRVLLDGLGGDGTISRGGGRMVELFFQGRALTLVRELRALARRRESGESAAWVFAQTVVSPLAPPALMNRLRRMRGRASDPGFTLLHPRLAKVTHAKFERRFFRTEREDHLHQLESPMLAEGLELFDRMMVAYGVEGRYPLFDRRFTEYCVSLPADQKLSDGYSRIVARRAMEGIVPDVVRWRAGKGKPGLQAIQFLIQQGAELNKTFFQDASHIENYVDMDVLRNVVGRVVAGRRTDLKTIMQLWGVATLDHWLRASKNLVPRRNRG